MDILLSLSTTHLRKLCFHRESREKRRDKRVTTRDLGTVWVSPARVKTSTGIRYRRRSIYQPQQAWRVTRRRFRALVSRVCLLTPYFLPPFLALCVPLSNETSTSDSTSPSARRVSSTTELFASTANVATSFRSIVPLPSASNDTLTVPEARPPARARAVDHGWLYIDLKSKLLIGVSSGNAQAHLDWKYVVAFTWQGTRETNSGGIVNCQQYFRSVYNNPSIDPQ